MSPIIAYVKINFNTSLLFSNNIWNCVNLDTDFLSAIVFIQGDVFKTFDCKIEAKLVRFWCLFHSKGTARYWQNDLLIAKLIFYVFKHIVYIHHQWLLFLKCRDLMLNVPHDNARKAFYVLQDRMAHITCTTARSVGFKISGRKVGCSINKQHQRPCCYDTLRKARMLRNIL